MMKTKLVALVCALALLVGGLAACGGPAAAQQVELEGGYDYARFMDAGLTLNVYNWGEYMSIGGERDSMDVNAEFETLTGIKVNYTTFDTNEAMYAKLKSGGASYDIVIPSDYMIGKMAAEGMLAPLDFGNIPNYALIGEAYKNQAYDPANQYSVPYTWGYVGIIYNKTMVDDVVDSWDILWDEKYAGDILMFDNSRDAFGIALKRMGESLNPETTGQIDHAAVELAAQRRVVQAYVMDQIFDKMEGGEAALAPYYAGDAITMAEENPDLAFAVPKEGTNYFIDAICIPAGSVNQEAAEMYINFLCETAVAVENSLYIGYSTPNIYAEDILKESLEGEALAIAYPSDEVMANMETFTVLSDEMNAYMDKAWSDMRATAVIG